MDVSENAIGWAMDIDQIAMACHQANKGLCEAFGDYSQKDWPDAPEWARQSARKGVEFCIANPDAPASANHESWLEEKRRTGWRYGPEKNEEMKTHPCFVPYDQLPKEQQVKDHVFRAIVRALA